MKVGFQAMRMTMERHRIDTGSACRRLLATALLPMALGLSLAVGVAGSVHAQDMTPEQLEKLLDEQRMALEEAIANREATAAKARDVREALAESEKRKQSVEEELSALCEEQEELQAGSFDDCISGSGS